MSETISPLVDLLLPYVSFLIPLPIIIPALAAALAMLFARNAHAQRRIAFFSLLTLAAVNAALIFIADTTGIQTLQVGGWDAPVGITLVADRLSTVMLFTSSVVLFSVMWYAISQGVRDGIKDEPVAVFLPNYMLLTMGVNVSFLAGDLFNLYVGFEIFLVSSYVLLTLGASPARVRAGVGYVMVSMASSLIFVLALAYVYAAVGTMNMAQIGIRMEDIPAGTRTAVFSVLLIAFGIKAAIFPLDAWLPDSYPTAPSLVTAVFAGPPRSASTPSSARVPPSSPAAGSTACSCGSRWPRCSWVSSAPSRNRISSACCPSPWSATSATWSSALPSVPRRACRAPSSTPSTTFWCRPHSFWW